LEQIFFLNVLTFVVKQPQRDARHSYRETKSEGNETATKGDISTLAD